MLVAASHSLPRKVPAGPNLEQKRARIETLLKGWTSDKEAAEILQILRSAKDDEFGPLVAKLDVRRLLEKVHDHPGGTPHYQNLLGMISRERVVLLDTDTRARLICALQQGRTARVDEQAVAQLISATEGRELRRLKQKIDHQEDYHDLHQLVFYDVDHDDIRHTILEHFRTQAGPDSSVKLLSDIDDTFYANWKDERYPKGTVYPGVRQFYHELAQTGPDSPDDLTFVTARPDDHLGKIKTATKKTLRERGLQDMVVLAGTVPSLISDQAIADKKFQRMEELHQLYPEAGMLFVGDSGQGDALCGQKLSQTNWRDYRGTLIHDVVGLPDSQQQSLRKQQIYCFNNYLGAALEAQALALMSLEGVVRVANASIADFRGIHFDSEKQRQQRKQELQTDLARLNQQLPPQEQLVISGDFQGKASG